LLSEIEKYRAKNAEEETLMLSDLKKDEMEIIYRDVCLKISRHLLTELKNEIYYPSKELVVKLLKFYGFNYDFSKNFQENYQTALSDKKISNVQVSREAVIILFTFKMICAFQSLQDVCYYIAYLKNILLDRSNGVLTAEYETWLLLYEACLKIFSRYEELR
jgi:plasmid maintenance system antidote protein VapI